MNSTLKNRVDSKLYEALRQWQSWSVDLSRQPKIIKELPGGKTNRSFLVEDIAAELCAVVRINNPYADILGINRQQEKLILEQVSAAGLAPEIYFNDLTVLVSEYLPTDQASLSARQCGGDVDFSSSYQTLIAAVHQQQLDIPTFDYQRHLEDYWRYLQDQAVDTSSLSAIRQRLLPKLAELQQHAEQVLCHHDVGVHNLVERQGQLRLIDWEYAGMGIPAMDWFSASVQGGNSPLIAELVSYQTQLWTLVVGNLPDSFPDSFPDNDAI